MITNVSKNTPSLGIQEDCTISMQEIAATQLNESIRLFVEGRHLPAITLAGAAEEVLGKMLSKRGGVSAIHESIKSIETLRNATGLQVMGQLKGKEIVDQWNKPRNALKHLILDEAETHLRINLCDEAYCMIQRGLLNAQKIQLTVETELMLENWMMRNVLL